ncbi:MAG: ROK family protein [Ktedonobacterales bacterium]
MTLFPERTSTESDDIMKGPQSVSGRHILGLEIAESGTHLNAYLETSLGPRWRHQQLGAPPTPQEALPLLRDLILRTIYDLSPSERRPDALLPPLRLGIAFWGQLDRDQKTVIMLRQNPSWNGFPLAEALSAGLTGATDLILETAINAAAWCEAVNFTIVSDTGNQVQESAGSNATLGTLLYVHLGREVSASIFQDGQLLVRHGDSEERFGHTIVAANGPLCQCGGFGHLTPIASAQSLVRNMIGRASDDDKSLAAMLRITHGRAEALTAAQVVELATSGNPIAADILATAMDALALAISNTVLLLTPQVIVIGGPIATSGEAFLAPLRARLSLLLGSNAPVPMIRMGAFEPFTSLRGAHALACSNDPWR